METRRPALTACVLVFPLSFPEAHVCGLQVVHTQCLTLHWAGRPPRATKKNGAWETTTAEGPAGANCILSALVSPLESDIHWGGVLCPLGIVPRYYVRLKLYWHPSIGYSCTATLLSQGRFRAAYWRRS